MAQKPNVKGVLAAGGITAILASTCCLGPLVLLALGFPYVMPFFY
jgi:mercuric ion transport protein